MPMGKQYILEIKGEIISIRLINRQLETKLSHWINRKPNLFELLQWSTTAINI